MLALVGVLLLVVLLGRFASSAPSRDAVPGSAGTGRGADATTLAELQRVLDRRAEAVSHGDEQAWLADLDPGPYRDRQRLVLAALRQLPVSTLRWRAVGLAGTAEATTSGGAPVRSGERVLDVVGEWALRGVDDRPVPFPVRLLVRREGTRWRLVDDRALEGTSRQVFDLPGLQVRSLPEGLVVGDAETAVLDEYARGLAAARPQVRAAWGDGGRTPVVVLPATAAEFTALTGRTGAVASGIAAVTTGLVREGQTSLGDKVVVNPAARARLSPQGRGIVLTHELTHLAIRTSTTHAVPEWLSEGYAVEVSYRHLQVDPRAAAPELVRQVRAHRLPDRLPPDTDFGDAPAGRAYDEAWLAVRHLVRVRGPQAVSRFYRDLATGVPADRAWSRLGLTEDALVAGWRDRKSVV